MASERREWQASIMCPDCQRAFDLPSVAEEKHGHDIDCPHCFTKIRVRVHQDKAQVQVCGYWHIWPPELEGLDDSFAIEDPTFMQTNKWYPLVKGENG